MFRLKKLESISKLILVVLLLWYFAFFVWPMAQIIVFFEKSSADHHSLPPLEELRGVAEETRRLISQDSFNDNFLLQEKVTIPLETFPADHDSMQALELGAGQGVVKDTRSLSSQDSFNEGRLLQEKTQEVESEESYEYPWELCRPMRYFSDNEKYPLTALASFPGSGNTWTRYLIQQTTGIHTGTEYVLHPDMLLVPHGFPGEAVQDHFKTIVAKTHRKYRDTIVDYEKALLILRDPGEAILADFNRQKTSGNHTGNADKDSFLRHWKMFFLFSLYEWRGFNLDWLQNFKGPLHVVMYEDLVNNLEMTLRALITFLELPVDEAALQCTLQRPEGIFHRKQQKYDFEVFDSLMLDRMRVSKNIVYQELKKRRGELIVLEDKNK